MQSLISKTPAELRDIAAEVGLKPFAARQIAEWLYHNRATSIDAMTNISLKARQALSERYELGLNAPVWSALSSDGTAKYLFKTGNGLVETVFIPEEDRGTLCVSCQVGCRMNCRFCMTGKQGWSGNLSAAEIMNQILSVPESARLTNIVFMGMGEPFDNTDAILRCCEVLTSDWGMGWSPSRITVSTVGVIPEMRRFLDNTKCHLAVSLHNPFPDERASFMPAERRYSITDIVRALKDYDWTHQRRLSFEYILLRGVNDSQRHASELLRLLKGMECRINLIRWHEIPDIDLASPDQKGMEAFRDYLSDNGIICTIRRSRGEDIQAACGLLSSNHQR